MRRFDVQTDWQHAANIVISQDFLPKIGGAHSWLYESYKRWGSPIRVLTNSYSELAQVAESEREFDRAGHESIQIFRTLTPSPPLNLASPACLKSYFRQLRSVHHLAEGRAVILHCLRAFPDGFAGALYKLLRPRSAMLVVYAHGEEVLIAQTSRQLAGMARCTYRTADLVIVNSESTRRLVGQLSPQSNMVCVHPGVDPVSYRVAPEAVASYRASLGWPSGTVILATLGRMEPRKNHRMGIEVVRKLRGEGVPLAFVCAGEGEERPRLQQLVKETGLSDWIRFPGAVPEPEKRLLFAASDIYTMPSIRVDHLIEGFGIVFLEAAAAGVPSVCGNTGGQPEAVLDMETGIVVDGGSLEAVASAVRRLANDAALRRRMGDRARLWAAEHAWERVVERTRAAIQHAMSTTST